MTELISETVRTARREHCCSDCGKMIKPGDKYVRQFLSGDDDAYTWKAHQDCHAMSMTVIDEWSPLDLSDGVPPLRDMEDWREAPEHYRELFPAVMRRLEDAE